MKSALLMCAVASVLLTSSTTRAAQPATSQQFARLVGTWELDTGGDASHSAERRVIAVSADALFMEIVRAEDARPPRLTYRFDGEDSIVAFGSGKAVGRLIREGAATITETVYEINNSPITVREVFRVNPDGTEMTIDATLRVEHGYEGPAPTGTSKPNVSNAVTRFVKQR
jgi:hypothetical protein